MEEKEGKISISTKNIKGKITEITKKFKEKMKETNFKEETKTTKGFIIEMFKNPIEKIKEVANDSSVKFLKTSILLVIIWAIIIFIESDHHTIYYWGLARVFRNIIDVLKEMLAPAIGILVYSIIVLILNKQNKKSLTTIISTITITKIPLIILNLLSLVITITRLDISAIMVAITNICSIISIVLGYIGFKNLFEEEDNIFIKKYILIQIIYYAVYIILGLIGLK